MATYTIAEMYDLPDGGTRYIIEYEREGQGVQRPTFDFPAGTPPDNAIQEMKRQIDLEVALNEALDTEPTPIPDDPNLGREF